MAAGTAGATIDRASLTAPGRTVVARVTIVRGARPAGASIDARSTRWSNGRAPSYLARADVRSAVVRYVVPWAPRTEVEMLSSGFEGPASGTLYMAGGIADGTLAAVQTPLGPGTLGKLRASVSRSPGTGGSFVYDVLKNGSTTGVQVTIADSATTGSSAATVAWSEMDLFALRLVATGARSAYHNASFEFDPA